MKVLVFGNKYLGYDSMALRVSKLVRTPGFEFVPCEDLSALMSGAEDELVIMDVVQGIEKAMLIDDVSRLRVNSSLSLHDFDLAHLLRLLKEIGQVKRVIIIGVPMEGNEEEIAREVGALLPNQLQEMG